MQSIFFMILASVLNINGFSSCLETRESTLSAEDQKNLQNLHQQAILSEIHGNIDKAQKLRLVLAKTYAKIFGYVMPDYPDQVLAAALWEAHILNLEKDSTFASSRKYLVAKLAPMRKYFGPELSKLFIRRFVTGNSLTILSDYVVTGRTDTLRILVLADFLDDVGIYPQLAKYMRIHSTKTSELGSEDRDFLEKYPHPNRANRNVRGLLIEELWNLPATRTRSTEYQFDSNGIPEQLKVGYEDIAILLAASLPEFVVFDKLTSSGFRSEIIPGATELFLKIPAMDISLRWVDQDRFVADYPFKNLVTKLHFVDEQRSPSIQSVSDVLDVKLYPSINEITLYNPPHLPQFLNLLGNSLGLSRLKKINIWGQASNQEVLTFLRSANIRPGSIIYFHGQSAGESSDFLNEVTPRIQNLRFSNWGTNNGEPVLTVTFN